jgi:putative ABC transport system substrate-binding protein
MLAMAGRSLLPARRRFVVGTLAALIARTPVAAQPRTARVGILGAASKSYFDPDIKAFLGGLRDAGWIEGQNLTIEARYANDRYDQLPALATELVKIPVDVIFALALPASQVAKRATSTIPIVIETLGDAVSTGLVPNLARPGGNVTGVSGFAPELSGKRIGLLRELIPKLSRVALLANRENPGTPAVLRSLEKPAQQARVQLIVLDAGTAAALTTAFDRMAKERAEAVILAADPFLFSQRKRIIDLTAEHRLPAVYEYRYFVEAGGLMAYGPDPLDRWQRAAFYVDRILRGARPGDLPIEQPSRFELALNTTTATRLGLTIPDALRLRVDHLVE